jgi:pilus assembly protein Flp/PilA
MKRLLHLLLSEDGPTAVEYAIMLALIVGAALVGINAMGQQTAACFLYTHNSIESAISGS